MFHVCTLRKTNFQNHLTSYIHSFGWLRYKPLSLLILGRVVFILSWKNSHLTNFLIPFVDEWKEIQTIVITWDLTRRPTRSIPKPEYHKYKADGIILTVLVLLLSLYFAFFVTIISPTSIADSFLLGQLEPIRKKI